MTIHRLVSPPPAQLARALESFEQRFSYPLGAHERFRISHGDDYARFFRAIGNASVFVAERDGEVLGTLGGALCRLRTPRGAEVQALYIGDLKVAPGIEAGLIVLRLAGAMKSWAEERASVAFGVVMDGTPKTPERYTGRFGLPRFGAVGKIMVLRLSCESAGSFDDARCSAAEGLSTYRLLTSGSYTPVIGAAEERSAMTPTWLRLASGRACALLEDTRKAKRLFSLAGQELQSAHLSCFAFDDVDAGAKLLKTATAAAAALGSPALFCAVPSERAGALLGALGELRGVLAPATVYAAGLEPGSPWHLNTAEI